MTSCKWKDGTPLPPTVSATYKGLLKACSEEGVPIGALFVHPDMPFNEHDITDLQRRIERMAQAHNVQVEMISQLAVERNNLQALLAMSNQLRAQLEYRLDHLPPFRVLMYHPESESVFESTTLGDYHSALDNGCNIVTGRPEFEKRFKEQQEEM